MKKSTLIPLLTILDLLAIAVAIFKLSPAQSFKVEKEADIYLVKNKGVVAYKLSPEGLSELSHSPVSIAKEWVRDMVQRAELDHRYLIFSDEDHPKDLNSALVSLDFETGQVRRQKSDKIAYTSSGRTARYYYTSEASTEDMRLTAFDGELNGRFTHTLTESVMSGNFWSMEDKIYLSGAKAYEGDYEDFLMVFQEGNEGLTLIKEDLLHYDTDKRYMFGNSFVIDGKFYSPVIAFHNRQSKEKWWANLLMELDLETGEKNFFDLPQLAPYASFYIGNDYLAFSYEYGTVGGLELSLFNVKTRAKSHINLSTVASLREEDTYVQTVKYWEDDKVLILVGQSLLAYDLTTEQVLFQEQVIADGEYGIELWVNQR